MNFRRVVSRFETWGGRGPEATRPPPLVPGGGGSLDAGINRPKDAFLTSCRSARVCSRRAIEGARTMKLRVGTALCLLVSLLAVPAAGGRRKSKSREKRHWRGRGRPRKCGRKRLYEAVVSGDDLRAASSGRSARAQSRFTRPVRFTPIYSAVSYGRRSSPAPTSWRRARSRQRGTRGP